MAIAESVQEKTRLSKELAAKNDGESTRQVKDEQFKLVPLAFAVDANCYFAPGSKQEISFQQGWFARLANLVGAGLLFLVPSIWEEEILRLTKNNIPNQLGFNAPTFFNDELRVAVVALQAVVNTLRRDSAALASGIWQKHKMETSAQILQTPNDCLPDVLERYAKLLPPFEEGVKRNEFPDAFAVAALEAYAEEKQLKIVVATNDRGCLQRCKQSRFLIPFTSVDTALDALESKGEIERLLNLSRAASAALVPMTLAQQSDFSGALYNYYARPRSHLHISPAFQPHIRIEKVIEVKLEPSAPHDLVVHVTSDGAQSTSFTGVASFEIIVSGYLNARDSTSHVRGSFTLFESERRIFTSCFMAHSFKEEGQVGMSLNNWLINLDEEKELIEFPVPPSNWEPSGIA